MVVSGRDKETKISSNYLTTNLVWVNNLGLALPCSSLNSSNIISPVTWYGINYAGTQITQWECQNKKKSGWTGKTSFVLEAPLLYLLPSIIFSVPCDQIVERAYWAWSLFLMNLMMILSVALQTVVPLSQYSSQLHSIKGEIKDVSPGIYLLVFDNTFSR